MLPLSSQEQLRTFLRLEIYLSSECKDTNQINRVYKAKYLGIVDDKLTWKDRNLGIIKRVKNEMPKESLMALSRSMVESYLTL